MERSEIIVIGGGLGGLVAATLLARAGHRVRVLEQAERPGGRARSRVEQGFVHNLGAHALYRGGTAESVLAAIGVKPTGGLVSGKGGYVLSGDRLCVLPRNASTVLSSAALDARGKLFFVRTMLSLGERKARQLRGKTVRQWLDRAPDGGARGLLEMFIRLVTYANAADLMSAETAARQLALAVRGSVRYVDGGWQTLVDAVAQRAEAAGVKIELGSGAARIERDHRARAVVTQDGLTLPASAVIAAVPPRALAALLPDDALALRWADSAVPMRAACLDLGVHGLPHPERISVLSADAPLYFANHSAHATLAPAGKSTLHLIRYLAPGEDGRGVEPELRDFLERAQPGVYARAEVKRFLPNLTVHNDVPCSARVQPEHPEIAGLYLVGDFTAKRGMLLDGVLESAREAVARIAAERPAAAGPLSRSAAASDADRAA
jgi:phytoene dehydrogenase-like protein